MTTKFPAFLLRNLGVRQVSRRLFRCLGGRFLLSMVRPRSLAQPLYQQPWLCLPLNPWALPCLWCRLSFRRFLRWFTSGYRGSFPFKLFLCRRWFERRTVLFLARFGEKLGHPIGHVLCGGRAAFGADVRRRLHLAAGGRCFGHLGARGASGCAWNCGGSCRWGGRCCWCCVFSHKFMSNRVLNCRCRSVSVPPHSPSSSSKYSEIATHQLYASARPRRFPCRQPLPCFACPSPPTQHKRLPEIGAIDNVLPILGECRMVFEI